MDSTSIYNVSYDGKPEDKGFESVDRNQIDIEDAIQAAEDKASASRMSGAVDKMLRMRIEKTIQSRVAEEYKILFARQTVFNLNKRGVGMIGYFAESLKNTVWPDQFYWYG